MYAMERFIQGTILIVILTVWECFNTDYIYIVLFASGILLCAGCQRSLTDGDSLLSTVIRVVICVLFVAVSGDFVSYLIFYECQLFKSKYADVALMMGTYFLSQIILQDEQLPTIVLYTLMLGVLSLIMHIIQQLIEKYIKARNQVSKVVSVTAINEMYVKKLNQELIIKNYLADKSARLEERENISRNIHNSVGHSITAAIMTLDAADMLFDTAPDKARDKMNTANKRIRTSLDSIRQAVRVLDSESEFVNIEDFIRELTDVVDNFVMDTMIKVYTDFEDIVNGVVIPHEHTEFLTGAVQELLSNGVRHGGADVFTVTVISDSGNLKVKVADNGKSDFDNKNQRERIDNGFGLKKIISYVKRCGGTVLFYNDNGFRSEISIKLFKEDENE